MKSFGFNYERGPAEPALDWSAFSTSRVVVGVEAFPIYRQSLVELGHQDNRRKNSITMPLVGRILKTTGDCQVECGDRVVTVGNPFRGEFHTSATNVVPVSYDPIATAFWLGAPRIALEILLQTVPLGTDDWVVQTLPSSSIGKWIMRFSHALRIRTINVVNTQEEAVEVVASHGDMIARYDDRHSTQNLKELFVRNLPSLAVLPPGSPSVEWVKDALPDSCRVVDAPLWSLGEPGMLKSPVMNKTIVESAMFGKIPLRLSRCFLDSLLSIPTLVDNSDSSRPLVSHSIVKRDQISNLGNTLKPEECSEAVVVKWNDYV